MRPQLTDEELNEALEQKAERMGVTPTEAVRIAVRKYCQEEIANDEDDENNHTLTRASDLLDDEDMRSVHQAIWRIGKPDGEDMRKAPLSSAKSVVAQLMGISKDAVRELYIKPLGRKQIIDVRTAASEGEIYVVDPDATVDPDPDTDTDDTSSEDSEEITNDNSTDDEADDDVAERMQQLEAAEPVRADGGTDDKEDTA